MVSGLPLALPSDDRLASFDDLRSEAAAQRACESTQVFADRMFPEELAKLAVVLIEEVSADVREAVEVAAEYDDLLLAALDEGVNGAPNGPAQVPHHGTRRTEPFYDGVQVGQDRLGMLGRDLA